jgi:dipeptidyl-peptidase-3
VLFLSYFQKKNIEELKAKAIEAGVTEDQYDNFMGYAAGFYANLSNYYNFGGKKFVPDSDSETFKKIFTSNPLYQTSETYKTTYDEVYPLIEAEIFSLDSKWLQINFLEEGASAYYSSNMKKDEIYLSNEFLLDQNVSELNTRVFKVEEDKFEITVASVDKNEGEWKEFKGKKFRIIHGEFSEYLKETNEHLEKCRKYCANKEQENMVDQYIKHYQTGDIEAHKESQRWWIKDRGPSVESNQGFVESYLDPTNTRAYFEVRIRF